MSLPRHGKEPPAPPLTAAGQSRADEPQRDDSAHDRSRHDGSPYNEPGTGEVPGERGIPSINSVKSIQSRVSTVLTVSLLSLLAAGLLFWYYSGAINRNARAQQLAAAAAKRRAQGDAALPSLGVITPPKPPAPDPNSLLSQLIPPPSSLPAGPADSPQTPIPYTSAGPPKKTPAELDFERRLGGPVLSKSSSDRSNYAGSDSAPETTSASFQTSSYESSGASGEQKRSSERERSSEQEEGAQQTLASLLRPTSTPAVRARVLPTQRFMLPKGAFIDCTLETAISSALPGMTTCVTPTDTFSADGKIVLLERGSKLVGETRGQVQQGKPRLFVLWTEARTPSGVVVPLASPGTDELGRSGLSGTIDYHWWQRFGTAILVTVIDGAIQGLTESRSNNGAIVVNPSTTNGVATEILRDTLRIQPTIEKPQGDRIQILVARDVDFRSVYALHATPAEE